MRHRTDRGATGLQTVAIAVLAALLVGTTGVILTTPEIPAAVCRAVGDVVGRDLGCTPATPTPEPPATDQDFEPDKCKVNQTGDKYSGVVQVAFVRIGENAGFTVTEYSDGSVTMMATNGAEVGAAGGFGADVALGELDAAAKVDFGGGLKFDYGSTWTFADKAQADQFRDQLDDYLADQWALSHPACYGMVCVPRPIHGTPAPSVPSTTFAGIETQASVSGKLGLSGATQGPDMTQAQMTQLGIGAKLKPSAKWTMTRDNAQTPEDPSDDTVTHVTDLQFNSETTGALQLATGGVGSMVGMAFSFTTNARGEITSLKIVSTSEVVSTAGIDAQGSVTSGQGDHSTSVGGQVSGTTDIGDMVVTETSLTLDPTDTASQQVVRDWMGGSGGYPGLIALNSINPATPNPGDPFATLLYTQATSSTVNYDHVTDKQRFALNVKFGLAFGIDISSESSQTSATRATYLGAPAADGIRPDLDFLDCVR